MSLPRIAGIVVLGAALAGCEPAKPSADSTPAPGADAITPPAEDAAAGDTGGAEDGASDGATATDGAPTDGVSPADGEDPPDGAETSPASVDELVAQLSDDARREQAATALAAHGAEAAEALRTALGSENPRVRAAAAFALSQMGPTAAPAKADLERLAADDEDEVVRDAARFALDALAAPGP